ncbi:MAG TPA: hypothetical protein VIK94_03340 [Bacilli bacterium]
MSILEAIQQAEAKAEELKANAIETVRAMLDEAKNEGVKESKIIIEEAEKQAKEILEAANIKIQEVKVKLENEYLRGDQELTRKVSSKFNDAVDYILGKVLML